MPTKYLDTNFILRLILKDNLEQFQVVENLLKLANQNTCKLFVSLVVVFETEWVLRSFYKIEKVDIVAIFTKLFLISEIKFEQAEVLEMAFGQMLKSNLGLEDGYHLAFCELNKMELTTFDKKLKKSTTK
jgi:predicted nucleic-acid-binding protein